VKYDCLIVDDEELLSEGTREYFCAFGVQTAWVSDAKSCLEFFQSHTTDLILLDINLGNTSGFELCRQLRANTSVPILFISARTSDDDMLLALNVGGDDYIQKPYSLSVLLAKVRAVLRRYRDSGSQLTCGPIMIDHDRTSVHVHGEKLTLKAMEYRLLVYLVENKNRVISKEELFRRVWGDAYARDNTLNVHVRHLREKIEENPNEPRYIKTVWGTGYIFEVDET
jgi:two-component system response regulator RegX3